jgi:hypothetical protein
MNLKSQERSGSWPPRNPFRTQDQEKQLDIVDHDIQDMERRLNLAKDAQEDAERLIGTLNTRIDTLESHYINAVGMLKTIFIQVKASCDDDDCGKSRRGPPRPTWRFLCP